MPVPIRLAAVVPAFLVLAGLVGCDSKRPAEKKEDGWGVSFRLGGTGEEAAEKKDAGGTIWIPIVTALGGLAVGVASSQFKSYLDSRTAQVREWQRVRSTFLNPLLAAARQTREWIKVVLTKIPQPGQPARPETHELLGWFQRVKDIAENKQDRAGFFAHSNGELYFAVSTLYVTAVYFAAAQRFRKGQPYVDLGTFTDRRLLWCIDQVRDEFSGVDGLWDTLQESIGDKVTRPDGTVVTYEAFCSMIVDDKNSVWLLRLYDFYREIGGKFDQLTAIDQKLKALEAYVQPVCESRIRFFGKGWIHGGFDDAKPAAAEKG